MEKQEIIDCFQDDLKKLSNIKDLEMFPEPVRDFLHSVGLPQSQVYEWNWDIFFDLESITEFKFSGKDYIKLGSGQGDTIVVLDKKIGTIHSIDINDRNFLGFINSSLINLVAYMCIVKSMMKHKTEKAFKKYVSLARKQMARIDPDGIQDNSWWGTLIEELEFFD